MFPKRKRKNDESRNWLVLLVLTLLVGVGAGGAGIYLSMNQSVIIDTEPAPTAMPQGDLLPCDNLDLLVTSLESGGEWIFNCDAVVRLNDTLVITQDTTLTGGDSFTTMISGRNALDTVIQIENGATLTLNNIHVVDSNRFGIYLTQGTRLFANNIRLSGHGSEFSDGAAIWNDEGAVYIRDSIVEDNSSYDDAAGILNWNNSLLEVDNTVFRNNSAGVEADGSGAGIRNNGKANIRNSSFEGNITVNGSGAAIANLDGEMTVANSVFKDNQAGGTGAAIYNFKDARLTLSNSQIVNNIASEGETIYNTGTLVLTNVTYDTVNPVCINAGAVTGDSNMCNQ
jgi:hypothetical protein